MAMELNPLTESELIEQTLREIHANDPPPLPSAEAQELAEALQALDAKIPSTIVRMENAFKALMRHCAPPMPRFSGPSGYSIVRTEHGYEAQPCYY